MLNRYVGVVVLGLVFCAACSGEKSSSSMSPGAGESTTGDELEHGKTFEVTGVGFGQKAQAAPFVWDDCSGDDPDSTWDVAAPLSDYTDNPGAYREVTNGVPMPHDNVTKYYGGGAASDWHSGTFMLMKGDISQGGTYPFYVYASFYQRYDPAWVFDSNGDAATNFKQFDFTVGYGGYDLPNNWYGEYRGTDLSDAEGSPQWHLNDDTVGPALGTGSVYADSGHNPLAGWVKKEVEIKADPENGFVRVYDDYILRVDYEGRTDDYGNVDDGRSFGFGGYTNQWGHADNWSYMADLYLDKTLERLVLANHADMAKATIVEPQVPTSWTDGAIAATCNKGRLPAGKVYAFVRTNALEWIAAGAFVMH